MPKTHAIEDPRELVCELNRLCYQQGWSPGPAGGVSLRRNNHIYMAPAGASRARLRPGDIYTFNLAGQVIESPEHEGWEPSQTVPLVLEIMRLREVGAVIHSHSVPAVLATVTSEVEFHICHQEMIKGIRDHHFHEELRVPIIENHEQESALHERLSGTIQAYKRTFGVLVRRHGLYCWGRDWEEALHHAETYEYLFRLSAEMRRAGLDPTEPPVE